MSDALFEFVNRGRRAQAAVDRELASAALKRAQRTWPIAILREAVEPMVCDNTTCLGVILTGREFIDAGPEACYCIRCGGEKQTR